MPSRFEKNLDTNEFHEAVIALLLLRGQLSQLANAGNPHLWSWVIVSLHSALQGFMVLALRGSNNLSVLTDECSKEWLAALERGDVKYPKQKLDTFLHLYKKIKSEQMNIYADSRVFNPSGTQGKSVKQLNIWRNNFVHFVPAGWMITVDGFPKIVKDCLDIIYFLSFESNNIRWHEKDLKVQTQTLIEEAMAFVSEVEEAYGG